MRTIFLILTVLTEIVFFQESYCQTLSTEITGMISEWSLTGNYKDEIGNSKTWYYSILSRIHADYNNEDLGMLSISAIGYKLTPSFRTLIGGVYALHSSFKPSLGVQFSNSANDFDFSINPNVNIGKSSELMTLSSAQYVKGIKNDLKSVSQIKSVSFITFKENIFTTFRFRLGIQKNRIRVGTAEDLNLVGENLQVTTLYGLFCQYSLS